MDAQHFKSLKNLYPYARPLYSLYEPTAVGWVLKGPFLYPEPPDVTSATATGTAPPQRG